MSNSTKTYEKGIRILIRSEKYENGIEKTKIVVKRLLGENMATKRDETKSLEVIKMEILMLEGKIKFEKIKNNLDEFEMKELEEEI